MADENLMDTQLAPFIEPSETIEYNEGPAYSVGTPWVSQQPIAYPSLIGARPNPLLSRFPGSQQEGYAVDAPASLEMLPDPNTLEPANNVAELVSIMDEAVRVLRAVNHYEQDLELSSARVQAETAAAAGREFVRRGGAWAAYASDVPEMLTARNAYLQHLANFKGPTATITMQQVPTGHSLLGLGLLAAGVLAAWWLNK